MVSVDSGSTATYAYDHQNRRVKKVVGSTTTHYVWEGSHVIAEHNGSSGALLINYTYSGSRMLMKAESGTTLYFLNDRLSARLVLNTSGSIVGRQAHLPFGEELNATGTSDKHRLTKYERDSESSNDYAVNRSYSTSIGRFNQADPYKPSGYKTVPQSWNRYSYVKNDPINWKDSLGLDGEEVSGPNETMDVNAGPSTINPNRSNVGTGTVRTGEPFIPETDPPPDVQPDPTPDPTAEPEKVIKNPFWVIKCNKNAKEAMAKLRKKFTQLASWRNLLGSYISFEKKKIKKDAEIFIQTGLYVWAPNGGEVIPKGMTVQVTDVTDTSWTFTTKDDHAFYPGTISFSFSDEGDGKVKFQIDIDGETNGVLGFLGYNLGGSSFEDKTWQNLAKEIETEICGQ